MMNLNHLKYFKDAADEKSIASAAKLNFVTSPAISQGIKSLENYFDAKLLEHGKNNFKLTELGYMIHVQSKNIFQSVSNFEKEISDFKDEVSGDLNFATHQSLANAVISKVLAKYVKEFPKVNPRLKIAHTSVCKQLIENQQVSFSISLDNYRVDSDSRILHRGHFVLVTKKGDKRPIKDIPYLVGNNTPEVQGLKDAYQSTFQTDLPIAYQIGSWGVISQMAIDGAGVALIPDYYLNSFDRSLYSIRKPKFYNWSYSIKAYYPKNTYLDKKTEKFLKMIEKGFKKL